MLAVLSRLLHINTSCPTTVAFKSRAAAAYAKLSIYNSIIGPESLVLIRQLPALQGSFTNKVLPVAANTSFPTLYAHRGVGV